jgi:CDP-Glycerol:Poly(glycerophosphate) glycerophosphotransferase
MHRHPMPRARVLLNCKAPVNAACLRPIVRWLRRDAQFTLFLTSRYRGTRLRPGRLLRALPPSHRIFHGIPAIPHFVASRMHFDLYLSPDMAMPGSRRCAQTVHLFHGVSFKGASISPQALAYSHLFLFGEYQRRRFVEKGITTADDPKLEMIGFPKVDCLVDGSLTPKGVRKQMEIEEDRRVVLYAPTWRGTSLESDGEAIIEALAAMDIHLILKLHDHSLDPGLSRGRWQRRLEAWRERDSITVWDDPDIGPAMMAADLLVSDISSVANEFTLLDRPIVFFETADLAASYSAKQIDHAMLERRPGRVVDSPAALPEAVTHALENPGEFHGQRRALARDLFHRPGSAQQRAVKRIHEMMGIEPFLPTQWAIDAAERDSEAREQAQSEEDLTVAPFSERGRYPGQSPMA